MWRSPAGDIFETIAGSSKFGSAKMSLHDLEAFFALLDYVKTEYADPRIETNFLNLIEAFRGDSQYMLRSLQQHDRANARQLNVHDAIAYIEQALG